MPTLHAFLGMRLAGVGTCPSFALAVAGAPSCSIRSAQEVADERQIAHDGTRGALRLRSTKGVSSATPCSGMATVCAPLLVGSVPHPQASTARDGFVLAVESPPSPLQLTLRWGLAGLDQLRGGGTAAPAAWCRVVRKLWLAVRALLLCRWYVTPMMPAGVGWMFTIRWLSVAIAAIAEADPPTGTCDTLSATPAWRRVTAMEEAVTRSLLRPPACMIPPTGGAPRLRAFAGAPRESALAAESSVNQLALGLLALDRAPGRGAMAPATGRRAT